MALVGSKGVIAHDRGKDENRNQSNRPTDGLLGACLSAVDAATVELGCGHDLGQIQAFPYSQRCYLNPLDLNYHSRAQNLLPPFTPTFVRYPKIPPSGHAAHNGTKSAPHPHSIPRYLCIHLLPCSISSVQFRCTLFRRDLSLRQYRYLCSFNGLRDICRFVSSDTLIDFLGLD